MSTKPKKIDTPTELSYLKVYAKQIKTEDGKSFTRYFAYVCDANYNPLPKNIIDKDTHQPKTISTSITVHFHKDCETKLNYEKKEFPLKMTLLDEQYFVTIDKDKNGKPRLRNDGTKVEVCVITDYNSAEHFETPKKKLNDLASGEPLPSEAVSDDLPF